MVSENCFVVSEKSGKSQGIFVILMGGNPDLFIIIQQGNIGKIVYLCLSEKGDSPKTFLLDNSPSSL